MRKKIVLLGCLVLVNVLFLSAAQGQDNGIGDFPTFIPNNMMTTPYGPAFADSSWCHRISCHVKAGHLRYVIILVQNPRPALSRKTGNSPVANVSSLPPGSPL